MADEEADGYVVSDPELITQVRNGDRQAFGELYRRHSGPATTLARQFARNAAEADDLVSESFARVLDNLLEGKGPDSAFRAYLFTTIRNTAYDRTRKDKRLQFTDDMTTHDAPIPGDDPVLMKMESGLVATAFAQLPERWQAVLWHTQVEGESPAQVGALLGMAPGAVSSLAFRAREGLREAYLQAHLAETAAEQCRSTVERLGAWTRGGLSKRETQQVDAHLKTCDRCRALAVELQEVNHNLRGLLAPLLLGGAAAGYLATLGPVTPLAVPGALAAGAGGSAGSGGAGSGGAAAGAGAGGAGAAAGAGAAGAAAAAAAAAAGAAALGLGALASASDSTAATNSAAGGTAAGSASGGAAAAAAGAAASGSAGAGAAAGLSGIAASLGVGGLIAAGAVVAAAVIAAIVLIVANNSPDTMNTVADQPPAAAAPATPGGTDGSGAADGASGGTNGSDGTGGGSATDGTGSDAGGTEATSPAGAGAGTGTDGSAAGGTGTGGTSGNGTGPGGTGTGPGGTGPGTGGTEGTGSGNGSSDNGSGGDNGNGGDNGSGNGNGTDNEPSPSPANLTVATAPQVTGSLLAGGSAAISATVTNSGQQQSATQQISVQTPAGVTVTGVALTPQGNGLRRAAAAAIPVSCNPTADLCTAEFTVAGGSSLTVSATIAATRAATGGNATVGMLGTAFTLPVTVMSPVTSLVGTPRAPLTNEGWGDSIDVVASLGVDGDPEPITFTSGDPDNVLFMISTGDCSPRNGEPLEGQFTTITCDPRPDGTFSLYVLIRRDLDAPTTLPVSATDSVGRTLQLFGQDGEPIPVGQAPADLEPSPVVTQRPVSGGTGQVTVTVRNNGILASTGTERITLSTLPVGIRVTQSDVAGGTCSDTDCTLPRLAGGESVNAVFTVEADPTVSSEPVKDGVATVVGPGDSRSSRSFGLPVEPGITGLRTTTTELVADGTTQTMPVIAALAQPGVRGSVIVTSTDVTFAGTDSCTTGEDPGRATCTPGEGGAFDLAVSIDPDQEAGPLPITARDEAQRTLELLGPEGAVQVVPAPADLSLTLGTVVQPVAGGRGSVTVTIANSGGTASAPEESLALILPTGITATATTTGVTCADLVCTLPSVAPTASLTVSLTLTATPAAQSGEARITLNDETTVGFDLKVGPGIIELGVDAGTLLADGTAQTVTVTAALADTVTEPGPITFDAPDGVTVSCTGGESATCDLGPGNTVELTITPSTEAPRGPLALTATDEGGRPILDNFGDLIVAAPARLEFTGEPQIVKQPVAGGDGTFRVTVINSGGVASSDEATVEVELPEGLTAAGITCDRTDEVATLAAATAGCKLPALDKDETVTVQVTVHASPAGKDGTVTVGLPTDSIGVPLTVGPGLDRLDASMTGSLVADDRPHEVSVEAIPVDDTVTEFGAVNFDSGSDRVVVTCGERSGRRVTCPFDDQVQQIELTVEPGVTELANFATTDERGRTIDNSFGQLEVRAPSSLEVVTTENPALIAGGTGSFDVLVRNTGGSPSPGNESLDVVVPDGIRITGMTVDGRGCAGGPPAQARWAHERRCTLPSIGIDEQARTTVEVSVEPDAPAAPTARVTLADQPSVPVTLAVDAGIIGLAADSGISLPANGSTTAVSLRATVRDGVRPGSVTVTATDAAVRVACADKLASCPVRDDGTVPLLVTVPETFTGKQLALSATDAGGRPIEVAPIAVLGAPALTADDATISIRPVAGGRGEFAVTVHNTGDSPYLGGDPITAVSAPGFELVDIDPGDGSACRSECVLAPIAAHKSVTAVVTIEVPATTKPGLYDLRIDLVRKQTVSFPVASAFYQVVASPPGPFPAGTSPTLHLQVERSGDSIKPGPLTFTSTSPLVTLSGCDGKGATLTCTDDAFTITVAIDAKQLAGDLPVTVTDVARNEVPLTDGSAELRVTTAKLVLSELTVVERHWGNTHDWLGRPGWIAETLGTAVHLRTTVTNPSSRTSSLQVLTLGTSKGLIGPVVTQGTVTLCGGPVPCFLPRIAPGGTVTVDLWVGMPPDITTGSVSVTVDGSTRFAQVTAVSPTAGATSGPTEPGTTSSLPGPTTGDPTTGGASTAVEAPAAPTKESTTAATSTVAQSSEVAGAERPAGTTDTTGAPPAPTTEPTSEPTTEPLPSPDRQETESTAPQTTASGGEPATSSSGPTTDGSAGTDAGPPPDPARLLLGQPEVGQAPPAGGSGTVTLTVRNDGGETSAEAAVKLTLPAGVSAASISVDGAHAGSGISCTLPAIAPHESVTVTVTLAVEPDAQDGAVRFDVPGDSARVDLTIDRRSPQSNPPPTPTATSSPDQPADRPEGTPVPPGDPVTASSAPPGS